MLELLPQPLVLALGWALIHSLWIGTLLAGLVRVGYAFVSVDKAAQRYHLALVGMLAMLASAGGVFWYYLQHYRERMAVLASSEVSTLTGTSLSWEAPSLTGESGAWSFADFIQGLEVYLPFLVLIWLAGAAIMALRLTGSWWYLHRLTRRGVRTPGPDHLERFAELCYKMGIKRKVRLLLSEQISEPLTLRHLKPIVLLPVGLLTQLSPEQVEVILLHELAHVKRWDYLVNWLQSVLELLFFYHPAVWWLSARVRESREHCCDDLVLHAGGQRRMLYAQTLTQVSAYSLNLKTKLAMSFSGNKHSFTFRVKRLFGQAEAGLKWKQSMLPGMLAMMFVLLLLVNAPAIFAENKEEKIPDLPAPLEFLEEKQDTVPLKITHLRDQNAAGQASEIRITGDRLQSDLGTAEEPLFVIDGQVVLDGKEKLETLEPQDIESVEVLKGEKAREIYGERGKNGVVRIFTKASYRGLATKMDFQEKFADSKFYAGPKVDLQEMDPYLVVDGKPLGRMSSVAGQIDQEDIQTVVFRGPGQALLDQYGALAKQGVVELTTRHQDLPQMSTRVDTKETFAATEFFIGPQGKEKKVDPYLVVNGEVKGRFSEAAKAIDEDRVATMQWRGVDPGLEAQYGAIARNGIVEVILKEDPKLGQPADQPLIFLDGEIIGRGKELLEDIDPSTIERVDVWKGESIPEKYGPEGEQGVIEITTKTGKANKKPADTKIRIRPDSSGKDPLYVVDGVRLVKQNGSPTELGVLDPQDIDQIYVLKGERAIKKYGKAGEHGVIEVQTKKFNPIVFVDGERLGRWKRVKDEVRAFNRQIALQEIYSKEDLPAAYAHIKKDIILITLKNSNKEKPETSGKLWIKFSGPTTIQDMTEPDQKSLQVDDLKLILTDFAEPKDLSKASHQRISTEGGILIRSILDKDGNHPLILLDGRQVSPQSNELRALSPKEIKAIEVIDSGPELAAFGEAGKYGVLKVFTRSPETELRKNTLETPEMKALRSGIESSLQVNPNPFNQEIQLQFILPRAGRTQVSIFDQNGRLVQVLADQQMDTGQQQFTWNGQGVPAGNYLVTVRSGGVTVSKSIVKK